MKIAIVVNSFPEFSETFIINKVIFLAMAGNNITVVSLNGGGNKALHKLYGFDNMQGVSIINVHLPKSPSSLVGFVAKNPLVAASSFSTNKKQLFANLKKKVLLEILNNNGYDIVHFEYSGIAASLLNILPEIKAKKVVSCRGSAEKVKPLTEPDRIEKLRKVFALVDGIHCVSDDMKQTIAAYSINENYKAFVNRPAIDVSFFVPPAERRSNDIVNILTIGRFTFQKGYLLGLMAVKILADKGLRFVWNIIGDGPQHEELVFHIHTLQLNEYVKLLGKKNKNEVNELLASSNIFLLTSVYEGIPNVVLEAMAMELPVVTTRCGGVDEVIDHGKDGFIAELYDVQTIANQLENLITNKSLSNQMGKQARNKILADYTLERQVKIFQQQYNKLQQS